MPYTAEHKAKVRQHIVEQARILFNRSGFSEVSIDQIMEAAGLTRGGFYNHFRNKNELYAEAVAGFLNGRGQEWRDDAGVEPQCRSPSNVRAMIDGYLSPEHLEDIDGQCPMIALPSDVARATPAVRGAYQVLLRAMTQVFETDLPKGTKRRREVALSLAALCVGGMVLSRTVEEDELAEEIRLTVHKSAIKLAGIESVK